MVSLLCLLLHFKAYYEKRIISVIMKFIYIIKRLEEGESVRSLEKISIIGLGLMGGSLALGLKNRGFNGIIKGYDAKLEYMEEAYSAGAIDIAPENLEDAIKDTDLIIIAVSLLNYQGIFDKISIYGKKDAIITDVGSVKSYPMKLAKSLRHDLHFIGGHPMSGSEKSGFKSCNPFLYENAYYFLTPNENTPNNVVEIVKSIIEFLGAYPVVISPEEHDRIVSRISHLPHLIAMTLVNLMGKEDNLDYLTFIGGGFRDTTRIASGNIKMWKDICYTNKEQIIDSIESFQDLLEEFKVSLLKEEQEYIEMSLEMGKSIRDKIPNKTKGYIIPLFEVIMAVEDKPGVLAEITNIIGGRGINIKKIEILNSRQDEIGAIRIGFDSESDRASAISLLEEKGLSVYLREDI